jgi:hypothetical protein
MWSRRGDHRWLEGALRAQRSEAPDGLVQDISAKVSAAPAHRGRAWSRVAFASAVSVFVLGTFASFGGLGYASSGASNTYNAVKKVVVVHKLKVAVHKSSAADQYSKPTTKPSAFTPPKTNNAGGVNAAIKVQGQTLPFTGFSLLGTFLASLGLIGAGIFLRRRERRTN